MSTPTNSNSHKKGSSRSDVNMGNGIDAGPGGSATKGKFEPTEPVDEELGWGIVRLYRDAAETAGLYEVAPARTTKHARAAAAAATRFGSADNEDGLGVRDEECTTLCILAVPSYLTPSDFLGFVGEATREEVSHFRMIRTERVNRYMVLMKFRNGRRAREWRREWNGKAFDEMEPENCHVVFVKSIEFRALDIGGSESSFPDMTNDPFTPASSRSEPTSSSTAKTASSSITPLNAKPMAPPTPALIELPTCPVCLERMDESTGLLTILCQHVFHCSCLQKWRGGGCPVCRFTQEDPPLNLHNSSSNHHNNNGTDPPALNECTVCRSDANLWICLICGNVGCGRYDAAHAQLHYRHSAHPFAMDLSTHRVWDYASDGYVHRIVQSKTDGKLSVTEANNNGSNLPLSTNSTTTTTTTTATATAPTTTTADPSPSKLDLISLEYTHLLTSQLASQRTYYEQKLHHAATKTATATTAAKSLSTSLQSSQAALETLHSAHETLQTSTLKTLERDLERTAQKLASRDLKSRALEREFRDEKMLAESLLARCLGLEAEVAALRARVLGAEAGLEEAREGLRSRTERVAVLEEENRDLGFFISAGARLRDVGVGLGLGEEEVRDAGVFVAGGDRDGKGEGEGEGGGEGEGEGKEAQSQSQSQGQTKNKNKNKNKKKAKGKKKVLPVAEGADGAGAVVVPVDGNVEGARGAEWKKEE